MTDLLTENARLRAALEACRIIDEVIKAGHTSVTDMLAHFLTAAGPARTALATPAPDAVQEAARVPEIAALIEAADNLMLNYLQDEMCEPDLCVDDEHWAAIHDLNAALRAIAGDRTAKEAGQ